MAILALLGFALLIRDLLGRINASDVEWTRSIYLLSGVEAIAFAGAGFLFGREVNRQRAESAEVRASEAEEKIVAAEKGASEAETKGKALAAAIDSKTPGGTALSSQDEPFGVQERANKTQAGYEELQYLARQLFPE